MSAMSIYLEEMGHSNPIPAAKVAGNMLYSSLITGRDPRTGNMPANLAEQSRNMFAHIQAIMSKADGAIDDIVKVTIWMCNRDDRHLINADWLSTFPNPDCRPARSTLNRDLGNGKLIECEIVAVLGSSR